MAHNPHMKPYIYLSILCATPFLMAAPPQADEQDGKAHNVLPALKVLPAGSILKNVRIPRYNKDYSPASILVAKQLKIINDHQILGKHVDITLFDDTGVTKFKTHLTSLNYDQAKGLLKSSENLTFSGSLFLAASQGLVLDWDNQRGFLLGKNQTIIYLKESHSMKKKSSNHPSPAKKTIAVAAAAAIASSPTFLSAQELAQLDRLAQPSTAQIRKITQDVSSAIAKTEVTNKKITQAVNNLAATVGEIPPVAPDQPALAELKPDPNKPSLSIKSEGLMFFNANKGIMVFSKNVNVKHPKFTLSCKGELKLILEEKASAKKLKPEDKAKLKPGARFGDLSKIIAINDVIINAKDNKGNPITARSGTLTYDHKTESFILRGLHSRITTADGQMKIVKPNGWIKINKLWQLSGEGVLFDVNLNTINKNNR